ncbi:unnamed protein product [Bursaphelenchus xylophilus]|uniref:(pine wood nematode) hypothetical protein n=1 Tax=Bursaphelenchus xylophilus TaxID=6326 RepID=A0A1I7RR92_BURXY|nr:unnamed protein product [Bursaphelenchus xylophilus]CAG9130880.1 unnamed protein product [Bursaphelenchus xylophilus]
MNTGLSNNLCVPGDRLFPIEDGYSAGNGCYEIYGYIHAALVGKVKVSSQSMPNGKDVKLVEICGELDETKYVVPQQGCIVTARVESVGLRAAKCSILCVGDSLLSDEFNAVLKKEDIREIDKDRAALWKAVQPGDLILARVIGVGDLQTQFLLSIVEPELGVVYAVGQNAERMMPENAETVKHIHSEYREPRKVADIKN